MAEDYEIVIARRLNEITGRLVAILERLAKADGSIGTDEVSAVCAAEAQALQAIADEVGD